MYRELITALRKTTKFMIIDHARRKRMAGIAMGETDGGAASDNVNEFGNYHSSDFVMTAELRQGSKAYYFLNMDMTDTSSGDIVWSDSVRILKE